jgi:hypothetical protein
MLLAGPFVPALAGLLGCLRMHRNFARVPTFAYLCVVTLGWAVLGPAAAAADDAPDPKGIELFESKIRPVLIQHCYECHSQTAKKLKGNLLLDTRAHIRKGGDNGPAVVPSQPAKSLLMKALRNADDLRMPPKGKLSDAVIADFEQWIARGAPDPREGTTAVVKEVDWDEARRFWAFQPPVKHAPPVVQRQAWPRKELDHFVLAELEKRSLTPSKRAARADLIRRATFDLIGLPPTPAEIDAFMTDPMPDAFAKVVDRLLDSRHYGERWGRHWLDVARFADDKALAVSKASPHSYRYRDWIVQALNSDMPYDRFLRLQLAGDLASEPERDAFIRLAGLGFQGLGAEYHKGNFPAQVMADELDDRIDTLSRGILGLTVACARCHDHKYDPIPTADYYSLAAAYQGSSLTELPLVPEEVARFKKWESEVKDREAKLNQWLQEQVKKLDLRVKKDGKPAAIKDLPALLKGDDRKHYDALKADVDRLKSAAPPSPTMVHGVAGGGQAMKVNIRGNVERQGDLAPPGFLRVLLPSSQPPPKSFTRLDLADAIIDPRNPLTARVFVNRVWQHHFGRGIVATSSNFGKLGERPTHPELLDTLAVRFVESGWSIRWLHREIMLSATYQQASAARVELAIKDPENHYLGRMSPRRLDFEAWRDALLAVSGRLDATFGGPPLELNDPKVKNVRRTIYSRVSRAVPNAMLTMFDFPDANVTSERRSVTTVPQQQLFALNGEFMIECARAFAARLEKAEADDELRVALAYRTALGRPPSAAEESASLEFLRSTPAGERLSAWEQFAQALLASNEFAWVE